jgi:DNA-binding CsgD family transcriptional regulator
VVYHTLLGRFRWRPADLAAAVGWSVEDTCDLVEELRADGLVTSSADDAECLRAVEPRLALPALMMRRRRSPTSPPPPAATDIERFIAAHEHSSEHESAGIAEGIFEGTHDTPNQLDRVNILVERMAVNAKHEVVLLAPAYAPGAFEFSRPVASAVIRRGVILRSLWCLELLSMAPVLTHARWLGARQAVPRAVDRVPARAMIVDGRVAVVIDEARNARGLRAFAQVEPLRRLAGRLWARAADVRAAGAAVPVLEPESQPRGESVLRLLAEGLTDDAIARRIGVSVRTVRNEVASLMASLDARSRFQAGLRAARLGLL